MTLNKGETMAKFKKILVANRGEIAMRIFRACHDLGLQTVAIYSTEDTYAAFRTAADESYLIGKNESPLGAYLNIPRIIELARMHDCDAIHPGYGFLSENGDFARACEQAGIKFIGPKSDILDMMGDKLSAKQMALDCNVPTTPGTKDPLKSREEAQKLAMAFGFPVILKAAAGGGGRGMRRCDNVEEVGINFDLVKAEALKSFGNDDIFMEKFLVNPKHVEVQVLADEHGNVVHLYERDCSLQRRYQKVVEYTPAFSVSQEVKEKLYRDAVAITKHVGYTNAGTLEFLVDKDENYYFIEMNPRIQVEHTVSEMVTGIDLVRAQIVIAEATAGTGSTISPYYDSLLVKVTAWDRTFKGAYSKALRAIREVRVNGVKTNIAFITNVLNNETCCFGKSHCRQYVHETGAEMLKAIWMAC